MSAELQALSDHIAASLGDAVTGATIAFGELTVGVRVADIVKAVAFLRDDPQCLFISFVDICGADYPGAREALRRRLPFPVAAP